MYIKHPHYVVSNTQGPLVRDYKTRRMSDVITHTYLRGRNASDGKTRKKTYAATCRL